MTERVDLFSRISPELTADRYSAIKESISSGATLSVPYLTMNLAGALIAGLGLMENSPATIIGAMLIAMLYSPIVGIGLALAEADLQLLGRSLLAEIVGAVFVLAAGLLIGSATRDLTLGSEILARTSPSLVDLLVALFAGLAGGGYICIDGLDRGRCRRGHRDFIGAAIDHLRHPAGTSNADFSCRRFFVVPRQLHGHRFRRDDHLPICGASSGCEQDQKSPRAEIGLRGSGSASRFSPKRHTAAHKRTVDDEKHYPKNTSTGDCKDTRSAFS
jgi:hypothetical protein